MTEDHAKRENTSSTLCLHVVRFINVERAPRRRDHNQITSSESTYRGQLQESSYAKSLGHRGNCRSIRSARTCRHQLVQRGFLLRARPSRHHSRVPIPPSSVALLRQDEAKASFHRARFASTEKSLNSLRAAHVHTSLYTIRERHHLQLHLFTPDLRRF